MDEQSMAKNSSGGMSNKTIAMLVVLAVVITAIGTWAVLNGPSFSKAPVLEESNTNVGIVTMTILPPPQIKAVDSAKVTLKVS